MAWVAPLHKIEFFWAFLKSKWSPISKPIWSSRLDCLPLSLVFRRLFKKE